MKDNKRIFINSCFIYTRLIIVSIISFLAVRYLLRNLGETNFGLYNLIGGIVVLFSFISATMSQSTQRFISISMGKKDIFEINRRFKAAKYIHFIIAIIASIIIQVGGLILIHFFLDIPTDRISDAKFILITVTIGTFFSIIKVPYDAVLMANENILFVSLIQTGYAAIRFIGILLLFYFANRLHAYAILMMALSILYYIAEVTYNLRRYTDIRANGTWIEVKTEIKSMSKFSSIYVVGAFATLFRDQGIPMVLNSFFGVVINAATAVTLQINGIVSQFSHTVGTAIRPQLIKSYGAEDFNRLSSLIYASCKYPTICVVFLSVPLVIAMAYIQKMWLGNVPEYAVVFSQIILVGTFVQQLSLGLTDGIDALGKIKFLYFSTACCKIITLPIAWIMLKHGYNAIWAYILLVGSEAICALIRIVLAGRLKIISIRLFIKQIVAPNVLLYCLLFIFDIILWMILTPNILSLIIFILSSSIFFLVIVYPIGLNKNERKIVYERLKKIQNKIF